MCIQPEKYNKNSWFLSPYDEISELAWATKRLAYANLIFTVSHDICRVSRVSHTVLSSPLNKYLMCSTGTEHGKLSWFCFCPMGGSMDGFQPHLVITMNKIRYQLAKLCSAVVHTGINICMFNVNIHWTHQNNITWKVIVSHLVRKLVLNILSKGRLRNIPENIRGREFKLSFINQ